MVNMKGLGVYAEMVPITSVMVPAAGGLVIGFSIITCKSALFSFWLSSVIAALMESGVLEITFTLIFNFAGSPLESFCLFWMTCHTFSAASLLQAGPASRYWRMYSQSPKGRLAGSFSWTALHANSCGLGAGVMAISAGGADWPATLATNWSQPS